MGIPTGPIGYGNDCSICFTGENTPKYVYLSFSGIEPGDFYVPGITPCPPNNQYKLTQTTPCSWFFEDDDVTVLFAFTEWNTNVGLLVKGVNWAFTYIDAPPCLYGMENALTGHDGHYGDGQCRITFVEPPGHDSALLTYSDLMGIPRDPAVYAEFWPLDQYNWVPMFASHRFPTKIHLKIDMRHRDQYTMFEI